MSSPPSLAACFALLVGSACMAPVEAPPPPTPPPVAQLSVASPWSVVEQTDATVLLRWRQTGHGVRVDLTRDDRGRWPGVSVIDGGTTLETDGAGGRAPLVAVGWPAHPLTDAVIESQGPDLRVRLAGPPLSSLTDDPAAPDDPVLTWVRVRPRGDRWRVVVRGLAVITLPAPVVDGLTELSTEAGAVRDRWAVRPDGPVRQLDVTPALRGRQPYPTTVVEWRSDGPLDPTAAAGARTVGRPEASTP